MKRIILVGDSIRMGYQETVRAELVGWADVWTPEQNGGTSENVLAHLDECVVDHNTRVIHTFLRQKFRNLVKGHVAGHVRHAHSF